jgi:hypothetical protein
VRSLGLLALSMSVEGDDFRPECARDRDGGRRLSARRRPHEHVEGSHER